MITKSTIYLPGLNGIRAIAALAVVISHTNGHLSNFGLTSIRYWDLAGFGVTIFFTLSGFLITFLLFKEKEETNYIDIKKFYTRRILRIWPLYYFYLFLIVAIMGYAALGKTLFLYLAIMPNIANGFITYEALPWALPTGTAMFLIGHYWSLGVEEQFYAFWPWIIRKLPKPLLFLICFPIFFLVIKMIAKFMNFPLPIQFILHYSRFGCLVIGALGAYLYFKNYQFLKYFKNIFVQIIPWFFLLLVAFNKFHIFSVIDHEIISIMVIIIILTQISNYKKIINLENKILDYLGKISFGIYVYNPLVIYLLYSLCSNYIILTENILSYILVYSTVLLTNIAFAHISHFTLEKYFINLKKKYITVKSAASQKESYEN